MVTPSRFFTSAKPSPLEQHDNATKQERLYVGFGQEGAEISTLSDGTRLETSKPTLVRDGLYSVDLTMIVGVDQHKRTIVVKAREGETEGGVKQRAHAAFIRSVCDARSVMPASSLAEDEASHRSRRVRIR
jgi:hypothetical protein